MSKIVYINSDYQCYEENGDNLRAVETNFFEGKCKVFIEGYRFIPAGEVWQREDGLLFLGEAAFPFKDPTELNAAQREYEKAQIEEYIQALEIMGVVV